MSTSEISSFASNVDGFFQKYIPREHEKTLRSSFIQAIAIVTVAGIFFGLYYVYSILEPFCIPLFWALLSGIVLYPYKRIITKCFRSYLDKVIRNDQTIAVSFGLTFVEIIDNTADAIGAYITNKWKVIVSVTVLLPVIHCITYFFPGALSELLNILQKFAFVDIISSLNSVQLHHVLVALVIFLLTLMVDKDEYRLLCQISSCVTWIMSGAYLSNFLWPPLLYLSALLWVFGYCTEPAHDDEPDGSPDSGQDTRIKSVVMSFLSQLGLLSSVEVVDSPPKEDIDRRASDPAPTTSTPLATQQMKEAPISEESRETECESNRITKALNLETTNKVVTVADTPKLLHPGISKLQKEHGILRSKEAFRNMSVIDKAGTPLGGNTPKSRVLGRSSYVFRLKRRSSLHRLGTDSWTYIRYALWSCVLLQLWVRPALAHLLPAPIAYYMIKQLSHYTGFTQFLLNKIISLKTLIWTWMEERFDLFFPPPLLFMLKVSYNAERKVIQCVKTYLDVIVTGLMILTMVLGFIVTTIFISFQVYTESVYIVQSLTSITSSLNVSDSYIFTKINDSFSGSGYDSMENVMDGAYNYSRDWISQTLRHSLADADGNARRDLELKVLSLWDRSYQYWVTDQRTGRQGEEAISSNLGELLTQLYSSSHVFNVSAIQTFIQNNMGTLTSISEQVWSLFKGNIGFLFDTSLGTARIILHSGSGVVNFVFSIFIYLTALFYLLSNSTDTYIPMEVISQYSIFQISGVGSSIQKAINSVFLITIKMSLFYLLWTYITHVLFDASIVVLPILFSSFIAACPFTGQYIVALPAAMELYCLQHRPLGALLLVIVQVAPSWLVDTAIYSEVRGGIHPWFTGLAVVGGVYVFGVLGAIYGPLALCVLYVIINVYSTFITDSELDDTQEVTRAGPGRRSTLLRSTTVG